jgi:nucleoside-triphosphatase THEP1
MNIEAQNTMTPRRWPIRAFLFVWINFDTILSIALSIIAAWFATFGGKAEYAVGATATALGILAFGALRDRVTRDQIGVQLSDVKSVLKRLLEKTGADDFFSRKSSERELIVKAEKELILVQETGRLIAETCRQELLSFLRRGGHLRWIAVDHDELIADLMALRNANLIKTELMVERMRSGVKMIEVLASEARGSASNIEVRFFPYPVDITAVLRDPRHGNFKDRQALIRLQGFQVTYDDKLDFLLNAYDSRFVYDLYLRQVESIWHSSSKCLFLTGEPRIGKSTLMEKVIDELRKHSDIEVTGFLTRDIRNGDSERVGFETVTVDGRRRGQLAVKLGSGSYELNSQTMEEVVLPTLKEGISLPRGLLVIDEIGPIQLKNPEFQKLIGVAMEKTSISIFGIVAAAGHPFLEHIHHHIRSKVVHVTAANRDSLVDQIVGEFAPRWAALHNTVI